jgi:hypothetical protein
VNLYSQGYSKTKKLRDKKKEKMRIRGLRDSMLA